jgi:small-conductance mechanosensitive channel
MPTAVSAIQEPTGPLNDVKESLSKMSETVQDTFDDVMDSVDDLIDRSTLAGQISPFLNKFILSKSQLHNIWSGITQVASVQDIVFLLALGFAVVPSVEIPYTRFILSRSSKHSDRGFHSTSIYHVLNSLSQVARLAFIVYAFDMVKIFLIGAGFEIPRGERLTHAFAYVLYTVWGASRLSKFKEYVLNQIAGNTQGRIQVVDRLGNAFLAICAMFLILDILNVEMGLAMRGVVAMGSVSTLVFSLAAKDTVANVLNGIILSASDRIYEGDSIQLHKSGFSGSVAKLGWLETVLRGSDEIMVTMPNSDLLSQRVCNLSRIHQSQVKQTLQFSYADSEKLPQLLQDIKTEIRSSCPAVITDGSRPFRCYWTSFQPNYLEVILDAHFRIKPVGDSYHENRQRVLQAIHRAVKKNDMTFKV